MSEKIVKDALVEAQAGLSALLDNADTHSRIAAAGKLLSSAFKAGNRVYSCGNGGSMCDAMHFAEELSGKFREDRIPLAAQAISDASHMSCVANDYGYDFVFDRYIQAHGRKGDVLLAISTSGKSKNVILAAKRAKSLGMSVIVLTGKSGSELGSLGTIEIATPAGRFADRVQELHIKVIHILIELVESQLS